MQTALEPIRWIHHCVFPLISHSGGIKPFNPANGQTPYYISSASSGFSDVEVGCEEEFCGEDRAMT